VLSHLDYSFSQPYGTSFFDVVYERKNARVNVCIPSCHALPLPLNPLSDINRTADVIEQETLCYHLSSDLESPLILIDDRREIEYPLTLDEQNVMRLSLMQLCSYIDDFAKISALKIGLKLPSQYEPKEEKTASKAKPLSFASVLQNVADGKKSFDVSTEQQSEEGQQDQENVAMEKEQEIPQHKREEKKESSPFSFASMLQNVAEGKDALCEREDEEESEEEQAEILDDKETEPLEGETVDEVEEDLKQEERAVVSPETEESPADKETVPLEDETIDEVEADLKQEESAVVSPETEESLADKETVPLEDETVDEVEEDLKQEESPDDKENEEENQEEWFARRYGIHRENYGSN